MRLNRHRVVVAASTVILLSLAAVMSVLIYWMVRPYSSVTFTQFQTDGTTFNNGDVVTMRNRFCWDGTPFISYRFFRSDVAKVGAGSVEFPDGYATPEVAERYADGCADSAVRVQISDTLPPGEWRIAYEVSYSPNPVRTVRLENVSNPFVVK